jgi:hypothetical protein
MREFLYESFDELRRAAGLPEGVPHVTPEPKKRKSTAAQPAEAPPANVTAT